MRFTTKKTRGRAELIATAPDAGRQSMSKGLLEQREHGEDVNLSNLTGRMSAVGRRE